MTERQQLAAWIHSTRKTHFCGEPRSQDRIKKIVALLGGTKKRKTEQKPAKATKK